MELNSEYHSVSHQADAVYHWLCDLRHFQQLMPEDKVSDFSATEESCSFKINGLARIVLIKGETSRGKIELVSGEKAPFPFTMCIGIDPAGTGASVSINFKGKANPMMAMMASRPLTNFLNILCENLEEAMASA